MKLIDFEKQHPFLNGCILEHLRKGFDKDFKNNYMYLIKYTLPVNRNYEWEEIIKARNSRLAISQLKNNSSKNIIITKVFRYFIDGSKVELNG
jgi:hypothetical protein